MEETNILKVLSDQVGSIMDHAKKKHHQSLWMYEVQRFYWQSIYHAHKEGKKLIMLNLNGPVELVYAFGAVPFVIDALPPRMSTLAEFPQRYIDIAEQHVSDSLCSYNKIDLGIILSGDIDKPDAFVYTMTPCDSARTAFVAIDGVLQIPSYCIDTPFRKDERGFQYIADQMKEVIAFLEQVTGNELDADKLTQVIDNSNKAAVLLEKITGLRKRVPCPLPSRFVFMNGIFSSIIGSTELIEFLEAEYALGKDAVENNRGGFAGEEKFRLALLQNMPYFSLSMIDWLEKEYGAVVVMGSFGVQQAHVIENTRDLNKILRGLARRMLEIPMVHAASGPAEEWIKVVDEIASEYKINAAMFIGHVGCKHTWAAGKLIKDMVYNKYGIPILTLDVDAVDARYKSVDDTKAIVKEYMDTLIESRSAQNG